MSDLISREALINEFKNPDLFNVTEKHLSIIGNAPAVDAVEVVRCYECEYFDGDCVCRSIHGLAGTLSKATDFCSYGTRAKERDGT